MFTVEAFTRAVMLEFPFPLASWPLAFCEVTVMSSISTVPLTLLTVRAGPPVAEVEVTSAVVPPEYAHVKPAQVSPP
jgi:hypothetical protein